MHTFVPPVDIYDIQTYYHIVTEKRNLISVRGKKIVHFVKKSKKFFHTIDKVLAHCYDICKVK